GDRARVIEDRRDLAEVEVPLIDSRLLDRRHDLADRRPDLARVILVERMARTHEYGVRATAESLCGRHRGVDAEATRDVVAGRDDSTPMRISTDDERHAAELRLLQLLHSGEERIEVEVGDDHANKRTDRIGA